VLSVDVGVPRTQRGASRLCSAAPHMVGVMNNSHEIGVFTNSDLGFGRLEPHDEDNLNSGTSSLVLDGPSEGKGHINLKAF